MNYKFKKGIGVLTHSRETLKDVLYRLVVEISAYIENFVKKKT